MLPERGALHRGALSLRRIALRYGIAMHGVMEHRGGNPVADVGLDLCYAGQVVFKYALCLTGRPYHLILLCPPTLM